MSKDRKITMLRENGHVVVSLRGEFDLASHDELKACFADAVDHGLTRHVIVDLGLVTFLDSTVLGLLVGARKLATSNNVVLSLAAPPPVVARLLGITQIARVITTYATVEAAVQAIRSSN